MKIGTHKSERYVAFRNIGVLLHGKTVYCTWIFDQKQQNVLNAVKCSQPGNDAYYEALSGAEMEELQKIMRGVDINVLAKKHKPTVIAEKPMAILDVINYVDMDAYFC